MLPRMTVVAEHIFTVRGELQRISDLDLGDVKRWLVAQESADGRCDR